MLVGPPCHNARRRLLDDKVMMNTPEDHQGSAPGQYPPPYGAPQPPYPAPPPPPYGAPQPPYPAPAQYGPPHEAPPTVAQPTAPLYPPPPAAPYGPAQPANPYGPAQPGQYPPPPGSPYGPAQTVPAPKKKSGLRVAGSIGLTLLIIVGLAVARVALRDNLGSDSSSTSAPAPKTPFEKTPADAFPKGQAGIVLPAAAEVSGFTKDQVAAALENVRKALVAARLDNTMLVKHDTSVLVALFAQEGQKDVVDLFTKQDFMHFATQIAPGYTLTSDDIRVKGEITFGPRTEEDVRFLEVKTNFVWVYPFTGTLKEPGDHLVTIHDEISWVFPAEADVDGTYRGMYVDSTQSYSSNIDCALAKTSQLALGKPRYVAGGTKGDDNAVFDPKGSLDLGDTC
jgi:hypothetical protein